MTAIRREAVILSEAKSTGEGFFAGAQNDGDRHEAVILSGAKDLPHSNRKVSTRVYGKRQSLPFSILLLLLFIIYANIISNKEALIICVAG